MLKSIASRSPATQINICALKLLHAVQLDSSPLMQLVLVACSHSIQRTPVKCLFQSVYGSGSQHEHQSQHRDLVQINADKYSDQRLLMPLRWQHKQLRSHTCSANHFGHARNTVRVNFSKWFTLALNPQNEDCLFKREYKKNRKK